MPDKPQGCHTHRMSFTLFFIKQFYKNIEAPIWREIFPKTTKNSKFERGNLPNESLDQKKNILRVYLGSGSGENLKKCGEILRKT